MWPFSDKLHNVIIIDNCKVEEPLKRTEFLFQEGQNICRLTDSVFSHTFVEKIKKSMNLLPVCKLYPTLLALLSHAASLVANAG